MSKKKEEVVNDDLIIIDTDNISTDLQTSNDIISVENKPEYIEAVININNKNFILKDLANRIKNNYEGLDIESQKELKRKINNYISSFIYCLFKKIKNNETFKLLKKNLSENEQYYIDIDVCCSNKEIKFSKQVVDDIIKIYELFFIIN